MNARRWDTAALGSLACSALATALLYGKLPDPIATHFDIHGTPNGWMPRPIGAWFMPVFGVAIWAFVRFAPRILPRSEKRRLAGPYVAFFAAATAIFLAFLHLVVLRVALVPGASVLRPVLVAMGAMFVAMGLVLPRVKRNPLVGVRTPWTLTSDENWARTQRVGGYAMVASGVASALFGAVGGEAGVVLALGVVLAGAIVPIVYSLLLARRADP